MLQRVPDKIIPVARYGESQVDIQSIGVYKRHVKVIVVLACIIYSKIEEGSRH